MKQSTYDLWYRIFIVVILACVLLSAFFLYQGYTARQRQAQLQANIGQLVNVINDVHPVQAKQTSVVPTQVKSFIAEVIAGLRALVWFVMVGALITYGVIVVCGIATGINKNKTQSVAIRDTKNNVSPLGIVMTAMMVMLLIRCQMQDSAPTNTKFKDSSYIVRQQDSIRSILKDPDSADFKNSFVSHQMGVPVVCGYVNARNGFGGYGGFERFISGGSIQVLESQMADGEMRESWKTICGK